MDLLIKHVKIIDKSGIHHGKEMDLLIRNGIIEEVGHSVEAGDCSIFDAEGAFVSAGWIDIGVQTGDPGLEHRETLRTVTNAAAFGGFTGIGCQPNTRPVVDSKSEVLYVRNAAWGRLVDCFPIGAVSVGCSGKDITEMIDMHHAGAAAFSDGLHSIQDSGLMCRGLQYVTAFGGVVINQPHDRSVAGDGQMHEGLLSTSLGMKGIPDLAEELMVQRDLELLEYTGSRLHLANISTAGSVRRIREAKARGLKVTCSVAALNLAFDDEALHDFDTNFKVLPPLRSTADVDALRAGLRDGIIDIISSNHVPLEEEAKKLEFPFAKFGAIGLETAFALVNTYLKDWMEPEQLVHCLALAPRALFRLSVPRIEVGQPANLTIFDPGKEWTFSRSDINSKSLNSPLVGRTFKGKVLGVVNNNLSAIFKNP